MKWYGGNSRFFSDNFDTFMYGSLYKWENPFRGVKIDHVKPFYYGSKFDFWITLQFEKFPGLGRAYFTYANKSAQKGLGEALTWGGIDKNGCFDEQLRTKRIFYWMFEERPWERPWYVFFQNHIESRRRRFLIVNPLNLRHLYWFSDVKGVKALVEYYTLSDESKQKFYKYCPIDKNSPENRYKRRFDVGNNVVEYMVDENGFELDFLKPEKEQRSFRVEAPCPPMSPEKKLERKRMGALIKKMIADAEYQTNPIAYYTKVLSDSTQILTIFNSDKKVPALIDPSKELKNLIKKYQDCRR